MPAGLFITIYASSSYRMSKFILVEIILLLSSSKSIIKETISPKHTLSLTEHSFELINILLFFFRFKSNLSETSNFAFNTSFTLKK